MRVRLEDIPGVCPEWQTEHGVKALVIETDSGDRSRALSALAKWKKDSPSDYKKIMKVIERVAKSERILNVNHVKYSRVHDVYEMKAKNGKARLLFFYTRDSREIVICTNAYWKTKQSWREQNESFEKCARLRAIYEESLDENK